MEKKNLIIRSFGTSDLKLDGSLIGTRDLGNGKKVSLFRETTEDIAKNFEQYKERISFPILDAFIEQKIDLTKEQVIIKGIFTDQEDAHEGDTVFLQEILRKKYNYTFAQNQIILREPRILQNNLEIFSEDFSKATEEFFDKIYVCPTGGTKGMVSALFMAALEQLDMKKTSFYYGEEQRNGGTSFIRQDGIKTTQQKQIVASLLDHFDFDAVISFVEINELELFCPKEYAFAKYMHCRLNADYETAKQISGEGALPSRTRNYISKEDRDNLSEKINGILYTWRQGRYVEFLGRIYNFTDVVVDCKVKELYHYEKDLKIGTVLEFIAQEQGIESFLNKQICGEKPLRWNPSENTCLDPDDHMNKYVKQSLIEYKLGKKDFLVDFLDKLKNLNDYRNKTVIAHGDKLITKEKILEEYKTENEEYGTETLEEDFKNILESSLCTQHQLRVFKKLK